MDSSKYDADTRRNLKLEQRSPAYRDLQRRTAAERRKLEAKLRARNEVIDLLMRKLVAAGVDPDEVAKLAA